MDLQTEIEPAKTSTDSSAELIAGAKGINPNLGGGYFYQWLCACMLTLNYFLEGEADSEILDALVRNHLKKVTNIRMEGEVVGEDGDWEDINLINSQTQRRVLIQVKTTTREIWKPGDEALHHALYRFCINSLSNVHFVFLTNRPFNNALKQIQKSMKDGTVKSCAGANDLCAKLVKFAQDQEGEDFNPRQFTQTHCMEVLERTQFVQYLEFDALKPGIKRELRAQGLEDSETAFARLYTRLSELSVQGSGGELTQADLEELLHVHLPAPDYPTQYLAQVASSKSTLAASHIPVQNQLGKSHVELSNVFFMMDAITSQIGMQAPQMTETRRSDQEQMRPDGKDKRKGQEKPQEQQIGLPIPLINVVREHNHLVILGESGTGKSTFLQYFAYCLASGRSGDLLGQTKEYVPIAVNLRDYSEHEQLGAVLAKAVASTAPAHSVDADRSLDIAQWCVRRWVRERRAVILLDGLDEVPTPKIRNDILSSIAQFANSDGRDCHLILTSQPAAYQQCDGLSSGFHHCVIQPLQNIEKIHSYVTGWVSALQNEDQTSEGTAVTARRLIESIVKNNTMRSVLSNPLFMQMATYLFVHTGKVVSSRVKLYEAYVTDAWQRAQETKAAPAEFYDSHGELGVESKLGILAWHIQKLHPLTVRKSAKLIGVDIVDYAVEPMGLLKVAQDGRVDFPRESFRTYFVALQLWSSWDADPAAAWENDLRHYLHHPEWREPLLLLAAMLDNPEELIQRVLNAQSAYESVLHRDLLLAAALLAESKLEQDALKSEVKDKIMALYFDDNIKGYGQWLLPVIGWLAILAALTLNTSWGWWIVWWIAATLLWWLFWGWSVFAGYIPPLQFIGCYPERWSGLGAFSTLKSQLIEAMALLPVSSITRLKSVLQGGALEKQREAVMALGGIAHPDAIQVLTKTLSDPDAHAALRMLSAGSLGGIGDKSAAETLTFALQSDEMAIQIQHNAARALGRIGGSKAVAALCQVITEQKREADKFYLLSVAAESLGQIGDSCAVDALIQLMQDQQDSNWVLGHAVQALGQIGDRRATQPLLMALNHANAHDEIAAALVRIGDPSIVDALLQKLNGESSWLNDVEAQVLGSLAPLHDGAISRLLIVAENKNATAKARAQEKAIIALGFTADSSVGDHLVSLLATFDQIESFGIREETLMALARLGDQRAMRPLLSILERGNTIQRIRASAGLELLSRKGVLDVEESLKPLMQALRYKTRAPSWYAQIFHKDSMEVRDYSIDKGIEYAVHEHAVVALGQLADRRALKPLLLASEDRESLVRDAVFKALSAVADTDSTSTLIRALNNPWSYVRQGAAVALEAIAPQLDTQSAVRAARALDQRLTDLPDTSEAAFDALSRVATQISVLESQIS